MLIKPLLRLPFSNLEELLENNIPCSIYGNSSLDVTIKMAPANTSLGMLNKVAVRHKDLRKLVHGLESGRHAVFTAYLGLLAVMHTTYARKKACSFYLTNDLHVSSRPLTLLFPKGSALRERVNPIITSLRESGIMDFLLRSEVYHAKRCLSQPASAPDTQRALQLSDLYGVFLLYTGCISITCIVFLAELVVGSSKSG
ncbi:glutamate receptor 1-like [Eriocheir sinensis]|uniref:glutamate receptor 1-like n=1 Tax=Eriocheir sinensis TaxID=95602 RepID=UPI0021C6CF21|nr:glutamate receptor 1-like [Eriocheir sinensis]